MNSIRRKLLVSLTIGLFILLSVGGGSLYWYARNAFYGQYDHDLIVTVRTFAAMTELELEGAYGFEFLETPLREFQLAPNPSYFQVWDEQGQSLARSPSLENRDLDHHAVTLDQPITENILLPDGRAGRLVLLHFAPRVENVQDAPPYELSPPGKHLTLAIARSAEALQEANQVLLTGFILVGLFTVLSSACLIHWAVRRGLRPLHHMVAKVEQIDGAHLDQRLPTENIPRELLPVGQRVNELLCRLEKHMARERRFTANVAHELRTPIAELRSLAEVGIRCLTREKDEARSYFEDARAIAVQMESLVTTLLSLARSESGQLRLHWQKTDISHLTANAWQTFLPQAQQRKLRVSQSIAPGIHATTEPALLKAILSNLLSNAAAYTPPEGQVNLSLTQKNGGVECMVNNTNHQLTRENLPHIFEPFWRQDEARTDRHHSGVGLSLVDAFSRWLHAKIEAELPEPDRFSITLKIPATPGSGKN